MVSFLSLALLASSTLASPLLPRQVDIPENWDWQVTNWEAGCSRSGCYYHFNLTVPSINNQLGVLASCRGYEQGYDNSFTIPSVYEDCTTLAGRNNRAAAKLGPRVHDGNGFGPKEIWVSFSYEAAEGAPTYNWSGPHEAKYNQFVSPPLNFTMTATEVFGVL
ncbi:unnamed protein product [Periconia digitata]|uniref:Uncharacterized protein n=1 Tax=Periconia digitata TaxID=1303443 RepID=A0A9W4XMT3_9PLEO|nr:unnamed protein product [Periconia digitata]